MVDAIRFDCGETDAVFFRQESIESDVCRLSFFLPFLSSFSIAFARLKRCLFLTIIEISLANLPFLPSEDFSFNGSLVNIRYE